MPYTLHKKVCPNLHKCVSQRTINTTKITVQLVSLCNFNVIVLIEAKLCIYSKGRKNMKVRLDITHLTCFHLVLIISFLHVAILKNIGHAFFNRV